MLVHAGLLFRGALVQRPGTALTETIRRDGRGVPLETVFVVESLPFDQVLKNVPQTDHSRFDEFLEL
jgi:hypothetical protein